MTVQASPVAVPTDRSVAFRMKEYEELRKEILERLKEVWALDCQSARRLLNPMVADFGPSPVIKVKGPPSSLRCPQVKLSGYCEGPKSDCICHR